MRGFMVIAFLLIVGTVFYAHVEGMSDIDAFYFAGSTLTTLGYGDIVPVTDAGKVFSVIYAILGIGVVFYVAGIMFHSALKKTLRDPLGLQIGSKGKRQSKRRVSKGRK